MKSVNYYYAVLGIDPAATPEQLRQAYLDLVKRWHPDHFLHDSDLQKEAEAKLKEINEAYKALQSAFAVAQIERAQSGQPLQGEASREVKEQRSSNKPRFRRRASARRADSVHGKKHRFLRVLARRLFLIGLGLVSTALAISAVINHIDLKNLGDFTGANATARYETAISSERSQAQPATETEAGAELVEQAKRSYHRTLKLLVQHEEEQTRLNKHYAHRRGLYLNNMISSEELADTEKALAQATERVTEDKRSLAKLELMIAATAFKRETLKQTEPQE